LDPSVIPPGYWTQIGVLLNVLIALIAIGLATRFVFAAHSGG
jgi:hypothetical protein